MNACVLLGILCAYTAEVPDKVVRVYMRDYYVAEVPMRSGEPALLMSETVVPAYVTQRLHPGADAYDRVLVEVCPLLLGPAGLRAPESPAERLLCTTYTYREGGP